MSTCDHKILCLPGQNPIVQYAHRRFKRNQNFICIIYGPTGSGKSYLGLRSCEKIDANFTLDGCFWTFKKLMEQIEGGKRKGSMLMWDEAGTGLSARDWYTAQNKLAGYLFQTFRQDNLGLIMTVPDITFIDSNVRKLVHATMKTSGIDYTNGICYFKFYVFDPKTDNPQKTPTIHRRFLHVYREARNYKILRKCGFGMPQRVDIKEYERRKLEWRKTLHQDINAFIGGTEGTGRSSEEALTEIERRIKDYCATHSKVKFTRLAAQLGIDYHKALYYKRKLEAKGYDLKRGGKKGKEYTNKYIDIGQAGNKLIMIS